MIPASVPTQRPADAKLLVSTCRAGSRIIHVTISPVFWMMETW